MLFVRSLFSEHHNQSSHTTLAARDDVLRKSPHLKKHTSSGSPHLGNLKEAPTTPLARRLADGKALELTKSPPPRDSEARRLHIQKITAQRRAERLAREAATRNQIANTLEPPSGDAPRQLSVDLKSRIDALTAKRRADRLARGEPLAEATTRHRTLRQGEHFEGTNVVFARVSRPPAYHIGQQARSQSKTPRKTRNSVPSSARGSRATASSNQGDSQSLMTQEDEEDEDERRAWDMISNADEDWCPEVTPPELTDCDVPFGVFGDVSDPPAAPKLDATMGLTRSKEPNQRTRETLGGDYSRFAPRTPIDIVVEGNKLDPVKIAQLALAKRRDVCVGPRKEALAIIASSVAKSNTGMVRTM